jgi:hypothetical protein
VGVTPSILQNFRGTADSAVSFSGCAAERSASQRPSEQIAAKFVVTGIYAAHITSLRTQMDAALSALGIPLAPYTDPHTLTFIKAVHFTDLQARIR